MRKIAAITEDEMIATFLYAEFQSPRFRKKVEPFMQQLEVIVGFSEQITQSGCH